ncbi:MAG: putative 1-acyl-sn-glycerol-3-phosphate acyltransferase [Verrucomicrobiota bacterium]
MILDSKNLIYKAVYHGARSFIEVFSTLEVEGWENVPDGACLFASNHQSMLDPPLIGSSLPREISFIARRTLFDNPLFGFVIQACHSIPVDRGEADIGAIRSALAALKAGEGLLIFPEGTRSQELLRLVRGFWPAVRAFPWCLFTSAARAICFRGALIFRSARPVFACASAQRCSQQNMILAANMPIGRLKHRAESSSASNRSRTVTI